MSYFVTDRESDSSLTLLPGSAVAMYFAPSMFMWTVWAQATTFWTEATLKAMTLDLPKAMDAEAKMAAGSTVADTTATATGHFADTIEITTPAMEGSAAAVMGPDGIVSVETGVADGAQPSGLSEARSGGPDDLKMISGVGPKIEGILHSLGIFHFDQVAAWTEKEVAWVDDYLNFKGRIGRDDWVAQADALAVGGRDEYVKRFGKEPR